MLKRSTITMSILALSFGVSTIIAADIASAMGVNDNDSDISKYSQPKSKHKSHKPIAKQSIKDRKLKERTPTKKINHTNLLPRAEHTSDSGCQGECRKQMD